MATRGSVRRSPYIPTFFRIKFSVDLSLAKTRLYCCNSTFKQADIMQKFKIASALGLLGLWLTGCANTTGAVKMYLGKPLPSHQVATLKGKEEYRSGSLANEMIRIVKVDDYAIPRQFGVGEGAHTVTVIPSQQDVKVLWVHARGPVDYYTYTTFRLDTHPNCTYQFYSSISAAKKEVDILVKAAPTTAQGNQACPTPEMQFLKDSDH